MEREVVALAGTVALAVGGAVATSVAGSDVSDSDAHGAAQRVVLRDVQGERLGTVWMWQRGHSVVVRAWLHPLPTGLHGFHVHTTGRCDPDAAEGPFTSAGAVTGSTDSGDLPSLLADGRGRTRLSFATSRFTVTSLRDDDGSAVLVHSSDPTSPTMACGVVPAVG